MSSNFKLGHNEFKQFELDDINSIVIKTQRFKNNIITEWDKVLDFVVNNPEYNYLDEFGKRINGNLSKIALKDEYIIDSLKKIYRQIPTFSIKDLKERPTVDILFYSYEPQLINRWQEENINLGEFDSEGILNNGSFAILRKLAIDAYEFLHIYYATVN